jgi:hypothetical protein
MFVLGKPFQASLLFVCKARSLTLIRAHQGFFNRVGSCFTNNHYTTLEKIARDKYPNLLRIFVNSVRKKFYNFDTRCQCYKSCFHHC